MSDPSLPSVPPPPASGGPSPLPVASASPPPPPPPPPGGLASGASASVAVAGRVQIAPLPSGQASIAARNITKQYGRLRAVDSVDFFVPKGSIYGLIGPNGAGKSTLMSMSASLLLPTSGSIEVEGQSPIADPAAVRARIGYMPDGLGVYEGMTVGEYLEFFAGAYRVPRDQWSSLIDGLLELVELEVKRSAMVNSLSRGMKQRLSLARALIHDPQLLILDEPASGLDPRARIELRHLITNLHSMGKTILVSSHILTELQEVCTHVGIMEAGRLLASGSPADILSQTTADIDQVRVRFGDGTEQVMEIPTGMRRSELLRQLVLEDPREVVEFADAAQGLEDVFLSVTEGIVQ